MNNPLPVRELREILGEKGFLRLYGQEQGLFVSDAARRSSVQELAHIRGQLIAQGFTAQTNPSGLLLINLQPGRWERLLRSFPHSESFRIPTDEGLLPVYALARLLIRHPAALENQPMDMIRAAFKRYAKKDGLPVLAPLLIAQCAQKIRRREPLPSSLADVLGSWLTEQNEEARI
jgi:hypothetical protein